VSNLAFLLPGDPSTRTGGYIYDARITSGLRALGWTVDVRRLHDGFPAPDAAALTHAAQQLDAIKDHSQVLIDGLAFGAMPDLAQQHCERLKLIALVHHPLAAETGLDPQQAKALAASERRALAAAHHVIVTSACTAAELSAHYEVPASKLSVVLPGTDPVPEPASNFETKARISEAHEERPITRLLCVASITPRKGHDLLIDALTPLAGQRWQLRCAGSLEHSPPSVHRLRAAIEKAELGEQVELLDEIDGAALHQCYQWADAFVLPTRLEGYGMALAEAIAYGLPVITTAGGAAADTVGAQAALLIAADDVNALSNALQRLMREPNLRAELAAGARKRAQQLPSWADASAKMHHALSWLLGA